MDWEHEGRRSKDYKRDSDYEYTEPYDPVKWQKRIDEAEKTSRVALRILLPLALIMFGLLIGIFVLLAP